MNVAFYCRSSKTDKQGYAPIEASVIINGKRTLLTLPRREKPIDYKRDVMSKRSNEVKDFLSLMRARINSACKDIMEAGIPLTADALKNYMKHGGIKSLSISELMDNYLLILEKRIGIDLSISVLRKYRLVKQLFCSYVGSERQVCTITNADIIGFYANINSKYKIGTTGGMMTKLKTYLRYAMDSGILKSNPFQNIKISKAQPTIEHLSEDELSKLRTTSLPPRLDRVRDIVLFVASCGLSYSDLAKLKKEDIKCLNGMFYISGKREKTGIEYTAPILHEGIQILRKYNFELPIISNQKINDFLYQMEDLCDIKQHLHLHLFRKTYATRLLNSHVKMETIARCLGHNSTKITAAYYCEVKTETILQEVFSFTMKSVF